MMFVWQKLPQHILTVSIERNIQILYKYILNL